MPSHRRGFLLVLLVLLGVLAPRSLADIVHYKDGRTIEGEIVESSDDAIQLKTDFGTITIERSKIARIEERLTPRQDLAARRAEIADDDAGALYQLALWAAEHDLRKERTALLREVIAAKADHVAANQALGRVRVEGVWMEPDEVEAYLEEFAAEKEAQGLLFHEGKWLPEAEVMGLRGMVLHGDAWLPRREAERLRNVDDLLRLGQWHARAVHGDHVTLYTDLEDDQAIEELLAGLESLVADFLIRMDPNADEYERLTHEDLAIYLLPDFDVVDRFLSSGFMDRYPHRDEDPELFADQISFGLHWPRPFLVLVEGGHLDVTGDRTIARLGYLSHQLAQQLVERFKGPRRTPGWLRAGITAWYEGAANHYRTLSMTQDPVDADGSSKPMWVRYWDTFPKWNSNLRSERKMADVGGLHTLLGRRQDTLDSRDIAVCWSVVRYLFEKHRTELIEYLRVFDEEVDLEQSQLELHRDAWESVFTFDEYDLDYDWRGWALAQPQQFPENELQR